MNRRVFLATTAGVSAASFLPSFAIRTSAQSSSQIVQSNSTLASVADTYQSRGQKTFAASATASLRLTATFFEDLQQSGALAQQQAYLLAHEAEFLNYKPSSSEHAVHLKTLRILGLPSELALNMGSQGSNVNRQDAFSKIQAAGLLTYYRNQLQEIASGLPENASPALISWQHGRAYPRFERVLDHLSCQIIEVGAAIAGGTGNAPAAVVLGIWAAISC